MTTKPRQAPTLPPARVTLGERIGHFFYLIYAGVMTAIGQSSTARRGRVSPGNTGSAGAGVDVAAASLSTGSLRPR